MYGGKLDDDIEWKVYKADESNIAFSEVSKLYKVQWPWLSVKDHFKPLLTRTGFINGVNSRYFNTVKLFSKKDPNSVRAACTFRVHSKFTEITYFAVARTHQNAGYGKMLHGVLMGVSLSLGVNAMLVSSSEEGACYWEERGYDYGPNEGHF